MTENVLLSHIELATTQIQLARIIHKYEQKTDEMKTSTSDLIERNARTQTSITKRNRRAQTRTKQVMT